MEAPGGRDPTVAEVPFVLRTGCLWGELHGVARADLVPQLGGTGAAGSKEMGGLRPGSRANVGAGERPVEGGLLRSSLALVPVFRKDRSGPYSSW